MLDELFTFPIVMIDGDNEDKKNEEKLRMGISIEEEEEVDLIFLEAEYPYYTFMGVEDRWLPTSESLAKAISGKFDGCAVRFANVGQLLVPWSKSKFKKEIKAFAENYEKTRPKKEQDGEIKILTLRPEEFRSLIDDKNNNNE